MLTEFKNTPKAVIPNDLLDLRHRFGGKVGELSSGPDKQVVLRLNETTFVTTEKPSPALKTAMQLQGQDLHVIKSMADLAYFDHDYKEFLRG